MGRGTVVHAIPCRCESRSTGGRSKLSTSATSNALRLIPCVCVSHVNPCTSLVPQVWRKVVLAQRLKEQHFVELPDGQGRVSVWDLWHYVKANPELEALAERDPAFAAPAQGMTRCG